MTGGHRRRPTGVTWWGTGVLVGVWLLVLASVFTGEDVDWTQGRRVVAAAVIAVLTAAVMVAVGGQLWCMYRALSVHQLLTDVERALPRLRPRRRAGGPTGPGGRVRVLYIDDPIGGPGGDPARPRFGELHRSDGSVVALVFHEHPTKRGAFIGLAAADETRVSVGPDDEVVVDQLVRGQSLEFEVLSLDEP